MKSLLVAPRWRWNGETEYAAGVALTEAALGFEVTVVAPAGSELSRTLAGSARLLELPGPSRIGSPSDFIRKVRWLSNLIGGEGIEIVHTLRETAHFLAALAAYRKIPLLHLRSGSKIPRGDPASRFLYRKLTAAVIVSSSRVRDWVIGRLKVNPGRVYRLLAPVDTESYKPEMPDATLRAELGIPAGVPIIVNVARLAPIKGHHVLVEAMARIHKEFPKAMLVLVGFPWDDQPEMLRQQAKRWGIERAVVFAGQRSDVGRFLSSAAVCVSSSLGSEENSRAVEEYMASGKPVVATKVGVISELIIDGMTGILVPPGDPSSLGEAIAAVLRDPGPASRMGREGRRVAVERFSREAFSLRLSSILESIGIGGERWYKKWDRNSPKGFSGGEGYR